MTEYKRQELAPAEFKTLFMLLEFQKDGLVTNKSIRFMSVYIHLSKRTLETALNSLEEKCWIQINRVTASPTGKAMNSYKIICPLNILDIGYSPRNTKNSTREFDEDKWKKASSFFDN